MKSQFQYTFPIKQHRGDLEWQDAQTPNLKKKQ